MINLALNILGIALVFFAVAWVLIALLVIALGVLKKTVTAGEAMTRLGVSALIAFAALVIGVSFLLGTGSGLYDFFSGVIGDVTSGDNIPLITLPTPMP